MRTYRIAAIPGDGIGTEVIAAGVEVLNACAKRDGGFALDVRSFRLGLGALQEDRRLDAGERPRPDQRPRRDPVRLGRRARRARPHHAVGPAARDLPAVRSIRQCAPDPHPAGHHQPAAQRLRPGARLGDRARELRRRICRRRRPRAQGLPEEVATDVSMFTRAGVTRIMRFAFALARSRPRKLLTVVTKSNAQRHGMVMWDEIAAEVAAEFPDVTWDKMLVDAMTMRMTLKPQIARHHRRDQPARRHPVRPCGGARRLARHRADRQPQSGAQISLDVRADPRLGLRHHGQGHRQPGRHVLVRRHDAGASRRESRRGAPDARDRARHGRQVAAHARSRRQGDDRRCHRGGVRGAGAATIRNARA